MLELVRFRRFLGFLWLVGFFGGPIIIPAETVEKFFVEFAAIDLFN